jgi:hypothetical protein
MSSLDVASYVQTDRQPDRRERTTMDRYPNEAWHRLGRLLERRRGELGYGYRQRARFVMERGGGMISVNTISRLEKGERCSYPESTVGTVESMYQWAPGSVERVLVGGEPSPLLLAPTSAGNAITTRDAPPTTGERIASWVYVRMRQRGYSEGAIHDFLDAEGLPQEPTTVSAVGRIAEATGATAAEVLALLGVDDLNARQFPRRSADEMIEPAVAHIVQLQAAAASSDSDAAALPEAAAANTAVMSPRATHQPGQSDVPHGTRGQIA